RKANSAAIVNWERQGKPVPPPHALKQQVVLDYGRRYGLRVMVETGTYLGDMVEAARSEFRRIYSVELDGELYRRAVERFRGRGNVVVLRGDSVAVLPKLLQRLNEPALFWLDGHYSS